MNVLSYSEVRASFKQVMDDVCVHHEPTVITRQRGEHVVMMSLEDYNSMQETIYLLSSPKNAQRLMESMAQIKAGTAKIRELAKIEHQAESEK
jgi:antitoxin YefM